MKTISSSSNGWIGLPEIRKLTIQKGLLSCGIVSSILYLASIIIGAFQWEGYSSFSQTISELIAIDAPTRPLIVSLWIMYDILIYAFGIGIWSAAGLKHSLRVVASGLIGKEILGIVVTLFFPIHLRGVEGTFTDAMHGILTMVGVLFYMLAMGFGATAFGKNFRLFSILTMIILPVFGMLAGMDAPRLGANLATPWMGVWERINVGASMLWILVLAITLLRTLSESSKFADR
jgi:K+-transporting ATPase A subunit